MRFTRVCAAFTILVSLLTGCATSIHVKVMKPAEINMSGARKLAIFSVSVPQNGMNHTIEDLWTSSVSKKGKRNILKLSSIEYKIGEYSTDNLIANLNDTGYFEIISPTDVERSLEYYEGAEIDPIMLGQLLGAEAIILSEITDLDEKIDKYEVKKTVVDEETEEEIEIIENWARKTVHLRFTYWVISTITDKLIATKSFSNSRNNEVLVEDRKRPNFRPSEEMYREILNGILKSIAKQLAPYEVWEARYMMKDKTKDPRMKNADNLVKGGVYDKALELFLEIWYDNQNPAAGVNAAILYEVIGNVDSAIKLIEEVLDVSADKKVMDEYKRLKKVKEDLELLEEQMSES